MSKALLTLAVFLAAGGAYADDGWEPLNGSVGSLTQHPSVRMVSEVVKVVIGKKSSRVDCKFVFKNDGKACSVRMRFPDDSSTHDNGEKPASVFDFFQSSIDGKKTRVDYSEHESGWIKTVAFGPGQTRIVEDHYRVPHEILDLVSRARTGFSYTLSTGGTWHGNIGRAEIRLSFSREARPRRIQLLDVNTIGSLDSNQAFWLRHSNAVVLAGGPCKPKLQGRTLIYIRKNFRPTESDDVHLYFGLLTSAPWLKG